MSKQKKSILAVVIVLALALAAFFCWKTFGPQAQTGGKHITVTVVHKDAGEKEFQLATDSENLRQALEEAQLIQGTESEYGLFVESVDGETADGNAEEWWCFTKGGEQLNTGVDDTMIADGESYEITFTTGYSW